MIYFGLPALAQEFGLPLHLERFVAAVVALSLNSAAYIAEIVRAGIQSIEIGQVEAAQSLGMSPTQTMRYIVFPQAFRRIPHSALSTGTLRINCRLQHSK